MRLVLCLSLVLSFSAGAGDAVPDDLDAYIAQSMKAWQVPGLAIAIVEDDRVVLLRGYGVREVDGNDAVDAETVFAIGSITKSFTATALGMLVAEGKLDWDDPATRHLPSLTLHDPYVTRNLTVRDLLTHRTGLPRGDFIWYGTNHTRDQILARLRFLEPESGFRERFGYQNLMYLAAGQIIPNVDAYSWDGFMREKIFVPLGMRRSSTSTLALTGVGNKATPHVLREDAVASIPWRNLDNVAPAGAINANVTDMAQWLRFNLGEGRFDGSPLLDAEVYRELVTSQMVLRVEGRYAYFFYDARTASYGLGWFIHDHYGAHVVSHGGAIDGMRSEMALLPEQNRGLVILTNMEDNLLPVALRNRLVDHWLGREPRDWSGDLLGIYRRLFEARDREAEARAKKREKDTSPSLSISSYHGTYAHPFYGALTVSEREGDLVLGFTPEMTGSLSHWQHDSFEIVWDDARVGTGFASFNLDVDGRVTGLVLEGIGSFTREP